MRILHNNCDPYLAKDRDLPYTAYLVEYLIDGARCFDIVISNKQSEIFDYYWDRYRENLIGFKQSEGRKNPKLWDAPNQQKKGK